MPSALLNAPPDLLPVAQIVRERFGRRISPSTIWRWHAVGIKAGEDRIKLEVVRCFGVWHCTREAFDEFLSRQTEAALSASEGRGNA